MQLTHATTITATEDAEHYRVAGNELLLTPDMARFTVPGSHRWETFVLAPEVVYALAQKIVAYYDEGNLDA